MQYEFTTPCNMTGDMTSYNMNSLAMISYDFIGYDISMVFILISMKSFYDMILDY